MSQFEDRLTDLLVRSADAVEVRPDLDRVLLDAVSEIPLARQPEPQRRHLHRRPRLALAATVAAAACVIAAVVVVTGGDSRRTAEVGPSSASTEPSTEAGSSIDVPRFLVTAPGWEVAHVSEALGEDTAADVERLALGGYGPHIGETTMSDGSGRVIGLSWYRAAEYDDLLADRQNDGASSPTVVAGRDALLVNDAVSISTFWLDGDTGFELRGYSVALDEYEAIVASVREVDQATWLAALPEDAVLPHERRAAVEAALAGVPVPDGVDVDALIAAWTANHAPTVKMEVLDAVVCGWVQQWVDGTASGDTGAVEQAVGAMASADDWPVMVDTERADYPYRYLTEEVADAMTTGAALSQYRSIPPGTGYQRQLGCPEG